MHPLNVDNEFGHGFSSKASPSRPEHTRCAGWLIVAISCLLGLACGATDDPDGVAAEEAVEDPPPGAVEAARTEPENRTRIVVIGSGTPVPDGRRGGPATAIVIDQRALLFDTGAGVLRGLARADISPSTVEHVFVTHLHSDHTLGLDEMIFGGWTSGRAVPLEVFGPPGIEAMVTHLRSAFAEDRAIRVNGLEGAEPDGAEVEVEEIAPGLVFGDADVEVAAVSVDHGSWERSFAYRVRGPDRVIVISGDTAPSDAVVEACDGCDVLVHEVYSAAGWRRGPAGFRAYHAAFHTSGEQLGRLAARARPRLLVLTHLLFFGQSPASLLEEVRAGFDGEVVIAEDGATY